MNTSMLEGRLLFAIPKKGRLHAKCLELLAGADVQFYRHNRLDVCLVTNHNIALVFLPASDIPSFVGKGNVDLGITGQDVILEAQMEGDVDELLKLGFGKCELRVQVPVSSNITNVSSLAGARISTSFPHLSSVFFNQGGNSIDYPNSAESTTTSTVPIPVRISHLSGSVEAACSLGLADAIVDLVESGETMRAAGLHPIATLLETEAVLIQSSSHSSSDSDKSKTALINLITSRLAGVIAASRYCICTYNVSRSLLPQAVLVTPGRRAPTISPLEEDGWVAVSSMVLRKECAGVMDRLRELGAEDVLVFGVENCRV